VSLFGKRGPRFDLACALSDPSTFLVSVSGAAFPANSTPMNDYYRSLTLAVAKAQVERFQKELETRDRYCRLVVWARMASRKGGAADNFEMMLDAMERGFKPEAKAEYYWHARTFIFMAWVTGREDLLNGVHPADLGVTYATWRKWLDATGRGHLRKRPEHFRWETDPDYHNFGTLEDLPVPPTPFTDWTGAAPTDLFTLERDYNFQPRIKKAVAELRERL
jgi:hypothetical protein